jgi:hypothetical protein
MSACPVTGFEGAKLLPSSGDYRVIMCEPLGGEYRLAGSAVEQVANLSAPAKAKLASWIVDQNRLGTSPMVTSNVLQLVIARPRSGVIERVHRLYHFLGHMLTSIENTIPYTATMMSDDKHNARATANRVSARAWTESSSDEELGVLVDYGVAQKHIKVEAYSAAIMLTIDGWNELEQLNRTNPASDQAFVAMWFGPEVSSAFEDGIAPAIRDAGYTPMRIDQKEHANRIDDEIIAEIRRSRFVVADFTCGLAMNANGEVVLDKRGDPTALPRGGVYYEAGFAQGLGLPVIWMCREDHINHVHFDTRQFNHITWTDASDLREKLKNRIGAVLGDGPHVGR